MDEIHAIDPGPMMEPQFNSVEELVFQHLRGAILSGAITAATPINQAEIAARLQVSRIPVRDALRRLQSVGLVVILPNRRAVVPSFSIAEIKEIFEMRALLEGLAARHAVEHLTAADFDELETLAEMMRRLSDLDGYTRRHEAFHDLIAQRSGLPRVRREVTQLRELMTPYIRIYGDASNSAEIEEDTHEVLVALLRSRDGDQAEKAAAGHVRSAARQMIATLQSLPVSQTAEQKPSVSLAADTLLPEMRPMTQATGKI